MTDKYPPLRLHQEMLQTVFRDSPCVLVAADSRETAVQLLAQQFEPNTPTRNCAVSDVAHVPPLAISPEIRCPSRTRAGDGRGSKSNSPVKEIFSTHLAYARARIQIVMKPGGDGHATISDPAEKAHRCSPNEDGFKPTRNTKLRQEVDEQFRSTSTR